MKKATAVIGCLSAAVLILSGCGKGSENQSSAAGQSTSPAPAPVPAPAAPQPPSHSYAMVDNGTYGYESALSEDDVRKGTATKPLIMMRYVGNKNGTYVIVILGQDSNNSAVVTRVSCQAPCQFAKSELISGDTVIKTETLRLTPDSIVGGMLSDAISGQLTPYGQTTANQAMPVPISPAAPAPTPVAVSSSASEVPATTSGQPQGGDAALQQTSFDCTKARSIPEYLICHDPDLAAADRDLATVYLQAKGAVTDKAAFTERVRKQWNFREKNCRDKECLVSWYAYQKRILTKIAQTGDVTVQDN